MPGLHKSGVQIPLEVSFGEVRKGNTHLFTGIIRDISDRKKSEVQLRQQAALIDIDPDAIFVKDMEDRIRFWSKGAQQLYGYTKEEVIGKRGSEFRFEEVPVEYNEALQAVLHRGQWQGEWAHQTKDGSEIVVSSR